MQKPALRTLPRVLHQGLYLGPIAMQTLVTLFSIPVIVAAIGQEHWGQVATGQSVGVFAGALLAMGWPMTGPSMVATARSGTEKTSILFISFYTKVLTGLPIALAAAVVTLVAVHDDRLLAVLAAWTTTSFGFAATWFFVGNSDPTGLVLFDALPRNALSFAGWVLVSFGLPVWAGLTIQLTATMGTAVLCIFAVRRKLGDPSSDYVRSRFRGVVGAQMAPVSTGIVLTLFASAPLVVANLAHVLPLAPLAIADKLSKQLTTGFMPVGDILLARSAKRHARRPAETRLHQVIPDYLALLVLSAAVSLITVLVAPLLIAFLGAGQIKVPMLMLVFTGLSTGLAVQSLLMYPLCLAFLGRVRAGRDATTVGSVVGIGAMVALGMRFGGIGVSAGTLVGCLIICIAQSIVLFRSP